MMTELSFEDKARQDYIDDQIDIVEEELFDCTVKKEQYKVELEIAETMEDYENIDSLKCALYDIDEKIKWLDERLSILEDMAVEMMDKDNVLCDFMTALNKAFKGSSD